MFSILALLVAQADAARTATDLQTLCSQSDLVVVAEVTSQDVLWIPGNRGWLETRSWLVSESVLKGDSDLLSRQVVTPGGVRDRLVHRVEDAAELRIDARYLLLLAETSDGLAVVGGDQGVFQLPHRSTEPSGGTLERAITSLGSCL